MDMKKKITAFFIQCVLGDMFSKSIRVIVHIIILLFFSILKLPGKRILTEVVYVK